MFSMARRDLLILIVPVMQKTIPVKGDNLAALFDDWRPGEATLLDIVMVPGDVLFSSFIVLSHDFQIYSRPKNDSANVAETLIFDQRLHD